MNPAPSVHTAKDPVPPIASGTSSETTADAPLTPAERAELDARIDWVLRHGRYMAALAFTCRAGYARLYAARQQLRKAAAAPLAIVTATRQTRIILRNA